MKKINFGVIFLAAENKFDKKKYEELYEKIDDKNRVILYLLSKNKISIEELCQLKISDVNQSGIGKVELPRREQAALARYFKNSKTIATHEDPVFPARNKDFLTPHKFKISFSRICKGAGIDPADVGINLSAQKESINEDNVNMDMVLSIIQEKISRGQNA